MHRILILENEADSSRSWARDLAPDRLAVTTTSTARSGVRVGTRLRPDLLVTDFVLKDRIHGLHASRLLHVMNPGLRTLVTSDFASEDLGARCRAAGVAGLLAKPFDLPTLREAAFRALEGAAPHPPAATAVLEVDRSGYIVHANPPGRQLIEHTQGGRFTQSLDDVLRDAPDLSAAENDWLAVTPRTTERVNWHVRSDDPAGQETRLLILRPEGARVDPHFVEMLLDTEERRPGADSFRGRAVVYDPEAAHRDTGIRLLEQVGITTYAAPDEAMLLRLCAADPGIRLAIVTTGIREATLHRLHTLHPELSLVAAGDPVRAAELEPLGVRRFVGKPLRADALTTCL